MSRFTRRALWPGPLALPKLPALLALLSLAAACGDRAPSAPTTPTLVGLEVEVAGELLEPHDTVELRARGRFSDGRANPIPSSQVQWAASPQELATIEPGGRLVAHAPGTVRITAAHGGLSVARDVAIPPVQLGQVALLAPAVAGMLAGGAYTLGWSAASRRGRPLPDGLRPAFTSRHPAIATVDSAGRVHAVSAGTTVITAHGTSASDSAVVTVLAAAGDLGLASVAPLSVEPGAELVFHGRALDGAAASVAGVPADAVVSGDTLLRVRVPPLPAFEPCLPPTPVPFVVQAGARHVSATLPAEAPVRLAGTQGAHAYLAGLLGTGCRLELDTGGHLLVPFTWERRDQASQGVRPDTTVLALELGDVRGAPVRVGTRRPLSPMPAPVRDHLMPDREQLARAAPAVLSQLGVAGRELLASAASCTPPAVVGDSMLVLTERTPAGRYTFLSGTNPQRLEWWHMVYATRHLAVVVDSAARRIFTTQAATAAVVRELADWYDAEAAPVFDAMFEDPLPDVDGNGRIVMLSAANSDAGGGGGTGYYSNAGCDGGWARGEAFYVPLDWFAGFHARPAWLRAYFVSSLMHEAAHTHDLARRAVRYPDGWPPTGPGSAEAMAIMATDLWARRFPAQPLQLVNHPPPVRSLFGGEHASPCWRIVPATLALTLPGYGGTGGWRDSWGYDQACQAFQYFLARRLREGGSLPGLMTRFAYARRGTYQDMATAILGRPVTGREAVGDWLLSWYADDRVAGAHPDITNPLFDTPTSHQLAGVPFPLPDHSVTGGGTRLEVVLGEPDARFILFQLQRPLRISVARAGGLPPDFSVLDVAWLRTATAGPVSTPAAR